jgi:hypothetical protein
MERKYNALRTVAAIMKVLGIIFAIITILLVIGACLISVAGGASLDEYYGTGFGGALGGLLFGLLLALAPILTTGVYALILYAGGEAILVHIDIEENTRSMVYLLRKGSPGPAPPTIEYPE